MRFRRRRGSDRRRQDNGRRNSSGNGNFRPRNRGSPSASQASSSGITHATNVAAAPTQPLAPSSAYGPAPALMAVPIMRHGFAFSGNTNPNARQPGTFQVQPAPTPVTVRRQRHIRTTVYGILPRMPHSSQHQHTGNLNWTNIATVPSPSCLRPCRFGRN